MKIIFLAVVIISSTVSADEVNWENLDFSKAIPRTHEPGFWDGRTINRLPMKKNYRNGGRIVGGQEVVPHTHPYQVGLFLVSGSSVFLCGASLIAEQVTLTAAHW